MNVTAIRSSSEELEIGLAQLAVKLVAHALQAAEAFDDAGALRTEQLPVHVEQAGGRGMEEQIDPFRFVDVPLRCEAHGIDAEQAVFCLRPQQALDLGDHSGRPVMCPLQAGQAVVEVFLVDNAGHENLPVMLNLRRLGLSIAAPIAARMEDHSDERHIHRKGPLRGDQVMTKRKTQKAALRRLLTTL